jgi:branched-chain amino acid transport system substrate-binding protein
MPGGQAFKQKFESKHGKIQLYAPYAHDAAMALVEAMSKANSTDPKVYLPALAAVQFSGVAGPVAFDAKGDIKDGAITLYQVKGGKWEVLETLTGAAPAPAAK